MEDIDIEKLQRKLEITGVAVDLYVEQDGEFTLKQISKEIDMSVGEIFDYFPNKESILDFFYTSLLIRYRLMLDEIDDFNSYSLSEKLSNFVYASFDLMAEKQVFVEQTFKSRVRCGYGRKEFTKKVEKMLASFFYEDTRISTASSMLLNDLFFQLLTKKYLYLVSYWINDDSEGKERSMELTDKVTAFIQEVMYNSIADKGFDLMKFLLSNTKLNCSGSFWDKISSKIEIR
ncbi:TetR/AcrR family transcriptional regulator [Balneolaceae bacterium YR4-1]|uniref:TetR/AcrR family transcriptional regulator n=1 Tax=Halalkalibaculum roseum TaxID=2709311 RepID=A0A6M1SZG8_9BACT|nr:TetR/AcrR family transcriptional regulator [Halalkalibaculum roseum]NGP77296.1 TetR/AcrR family transcriptional regulator [Halalkalibaculum roseum]